MHFYPDERETPEAPKTEGFVGSIDDRVRIQLGRHTTAVHEDGTGVSIWEDVKIAEAYEVTYGIFTQPAAFAITLGFDGNAKDIIEKYPPRTPFRLFVGTRLVQQGLTDGWAVGLSHATVRLRGRDRLQQVHDNEGAAEKSYKDATYKSLVESALRDGGIKDPVVVVTNAANRLAIARGKNGIASTESGPKRSTRPATIHIGETYFDFIKRHLDRAGLFLFAAADGTFILASPDGKQQASYVAVHAPSIVGRYGSVEDGDYSFETTGRSSETIVYARGGGKKFGNVKAKGAYEDEEMIGLGYERINVIRDHTAANNAQAEALARRRIAEQRRRAWQLNIIVTGHTTVAPDGFSPTVWTPDTMVRFKSEQLGLDQDLYVESVTYQRDMGSGTKTRMRLMRPEDLVFGTIEEGDEEG